MITITLLMIMAPADIVKYEVDRLNTNYPAAYSQSVREKKPIVVWVNIEDPYEEYSKIRKPAIHVFVKSFPGLDKGVVVGLQGGYRYDVPSGKADKINAILDPPRTFSVPYCPPGRA